MKQKLYPNCSEYVARLGIKISEIPYIKKRIKKLISNKKEQKDFLKEFTSWIGKKDEVGFGSFISEGDKGIYEKIKNELLAKRGGICPFCKEETKEIYAHIKEFHKEEIKMVVGSINEKEYHKIKREIILDNLL